MTTEEKIKVMQAYLDGKQIETRFAIKDNDPWKNCIKPLWNWLYKEYRIKPEPKKPTYRPYKDTDEMIADFKERFCVNVSGYTMPFIWVKAESFETLITAFGKKDVWLMGLNCASITIGRLFEMFTYLDGSPIGKEVEE